MQFQYQNSFFRFFLSIEKRIDIQRKKATLYPAQNLSCRIVKNDCECTSTEYTDWQITFTKYFPDNAKPLPETYILEGTFSGSLTKDQKRVLPPNASCNPVKVGFSGKFKLKSYYF
jgi:hypothetical protein